MTFCIKLICTKKARLIGRFSLIHKKITSISYNNIPQSITFLKVKYFLISVNSGKIKLYCQEVRTAFNSYNHNNFMSS